MAHHCSSCLNEASALALIIEIDGDSRFDPEQAKYDQERIEWLNEQKDYRVIRFTSDEVLKRIDQVLGIILEAL